MSMYAMDAGSRYLVKAENLDAAYEWLKKEGEFAHVVGIVRNCLVLSADGYEDMFCGNVSYSVGDCIKEFLERFCEPGSYACHHIDEFDEYCLYWKDGEGVRDECKEVGNPFAEKMMELEG